MVGAGIHLFSQKQLSVLEKGLDGAWLGPDIFY